MDLKQKADEYFSSINSIASRLSTDINQTKASYEDYWNKLHPEEQNQILNESIIKPEVQLKYQCIDSDSFEMNEEYSMKMIVDENSSYRDEHSAPFSFKTKSQRDLTIFSTSKDKKMKSPKENIRVPKKKVPLENKNNNFNQNGIEVKSTDAAADLPKTGLDFLYNW